MLEEAANPVEELCIKHIPARRCPENQFKEDENDLPEEAV
jgi:ribosome-binding factor A